MKARQIATWVPGLFFLLGVLGILALHGLVKKNDRERVQLETQVTAEQIRIRLEAWIDARIAVVRHLGRKQFTDQDDIEAHFAEQAQHLLDLYPGIQAINYIDDYWVIRIVVPEATNLPALDQDLHHHPNPSVPRSLSLAEGTGKIISTPVVELLQGGKGIATYQALLDKNDRALGYINGVFRITMMLDTCLAESNLRDRFRFRFTEENGAIAYLHSDSGTGEEWEFPINLPVRIAEREWNLLLAPSPRYLAEARNPADEILAVTGLILVALLSLLMRAFLLRQAALKESRAKYRLLVENQNDLVVQYDRDGRFLYVSPSYCQMFDKTEEELLGHDLLPEIHQDDREASDRSLASLRDEPHHSFHEQRVRTPKGWQWLAWSNRAVLDETGEVHTVTAVARDITHRRKLEDQLIQSQKMQAIGLLAGGIAHDFNNLLHTMLNNLELVFQEFQPEGQTRDDLDQVRKGVDKAIGLTRQLLAFSRQQMLKPTALNMNSVIGDMLQMMQRTMKSSIAMDFAPAEGVVHVHADRVQVEQIFMNLCVNAQDAISGPGTISVKTETRNVDSVFCNNHPDAQPGHYGVLMVEDTGRGMEPEVLERIFEPFFTTKEVGQGTGLGLSSIYGIVRQHGGFMLVESEPGAGTIFTVFLPRSETEAAAAVPVPSKQTTGGTETILLAEDNVDVRNLAVRVLNKGGYKVMVAVDGRQAVELFEQHAAEVDLVMLDLVMPRLGGRQAGDQIRKLKPGIRLLFASGYDPASIGGEARAVDQADLLMKPFGIPELLGKVREILDRTPMD
ncbi:MAG: ATP-binding protein [Candidatus Krumholzibacteriota bacterium]